MEKTHISFVALLIMFLQPQLFAQNNSEDYDKPLITDVKQLSSLYTDEGNFYSLESGYYRIRAGMEYVNDVVVGHDDETDEDIIEQQVRDKYMMSHFQDGKYWAYWGTPEDFAEETQLIRPLFKITNKGNNTYDIVSCMYNVRFNKVARSTNLEMTAESENLVSLDFAGTMDNITYVNIRISTQNADDYLYMHQGGHMNGAGKNGFIVGWSRTCYSEDSDPGASEWYFEKVDDSEAEAIIAVWQSEPEEFVNNGIRYILINATEKTCYVEECVNKEIVDCVIPETIIFNGELYKVTRISSSAFQGCSGLTSVIIPSSVTSIGSSAFQNCCSLSSIEIQCNPTSIGYDVFLGCPIESVVFDCENVTSLFRDLTSLKNVTMKESVTNISNSAFYGCSGLTSVTIPSGVTSIGEDAFYRCNNLTSVIISVNNPAGFCNNNVARLINYSIGKPITLIDTDGEEIKDFIIPESVVAIRDFGFYNCSGLTSVTIPSSVTSIDNYAFYNCSGLTSIIIPSSVTSIGESAFYRCSGLTSITIPNSVTNIGVYAFYGCSGLTSITIPNSVTSIGDYAFSGCSGLTSVEVKCSPTSIVSGVFSGCPIENVIFDCEKVTSLFSHLTSLKNVTMTESVMSIDGYAFSGCSALTSVTIPSGVTSIGEDAFNRCSSLTSVIVSVNNSADFCNNNVAGLIRSSIGKPITLIDTEGEEIKDFIIPESVVSIGNYGFYNCSGLTSVTIPNSVTSIGLSAFSGSSNLYSVEVRCSPTSIDSFVFSGCPIESVIFDCENVTSLFRDLTSLKNVTLMKSVTSIGKSAFYDCSGLTSITIPSSVTSIGDQAFYNCSGLTSVTVSVNDFADFCNNNVAGLIRSNIGKPVKLIDERGEEIKDFIIPESVTAIGYYTFYNCSGLTSITIPNSVTNIGNYAFQNCSSLTSVEVQCSPTSIGSSVFSGCPIESVTFDCENVTSIFSGLNSLKNVTITKSVTSIGNSAFYGCSGLVSITIPNNVTNIGSSAFYDCSGLTSVTIPSSVTGIGSSAFYGCSILASITVSVNDSADFCNNNVGGLIRSSAGKSITLIDTEGEAIKDFIIPESVTSIGDYGFYNCSGLTSVTIPNSVTSIGNYAFYDCYGLTSITIPSSVTNIGNLAFYVSSRLTSVTVSVNDNADFCNNNVGGLIRSSIGKHVKLIDREGEEIKDFIIPESVTAIGDYGFYNCSGLTSVTIPGSVTSIGNQAFYSCSSLTSIEVKCSPTSIGSGVFWGCPVENVTFDCETVTSLFSGRTSLKNVTLNGSVKSISDSAFSGCSGLNSISIPNSVKSIGSQAFSGCSTLESVTIGSGVLSIGDNVFKDHRPAKVLWLTNTPPSGYATAAGTVNYVANDQYTSLSNKTVYKFLSSMFEVGGIKYVPVSPSDRTCDAIDCVYGGEDVNVTIGETVSYRGVSLKVQNVRPYTCYNHGGISELVLSNGGAVGDYAFSGCTALQTVDASNNGAVGNYAFSGCTALQTATVCNKGEIGERAFSGCTALQTVNASNDGAVGDYAFSGCTALQTATVSNNGAIGERAFSECTSLLSANISNNGAIGNYAFYGCTSLLTTTVSNNGAIGERAFSECTSLQDASIGNNGAIGNYAFSGCTALQTATVNNVGAIGNYAFSGCYSLETATLGKDVSAIGNSAFRGCSELHSIIVPNAVKSIDEYAFYGCSSMASAKIGKGVKAISARAFQDCSSMTDVHVGDSVKTISQYAFSGCSALPAIRIPKEVTSIGHYVFSGCSELKKVIIEDRENNLSLGSNGLSPLFADCPLDSVYIGGNISYDTSSSYGYSPFYRNTSLRSITITDEETEISENEFYGCTSLKNVRIGDGVETIGNWAFSGCSSLDYFAFGSGLKGIGQEAFSDCVNVTRIISRAATPPTCGSQALDDINKWDCTLMVPVGKLAKYQEADQWKEFFFASEGEETPQIGPVDEDTKCATPTIAYVDGNIVFGCATEDASCHYIIQAPIAANGIAGSVPYSNTITVTVYATKEGFEDSDVVTQDIDLGSLHVDLDGDGEVTRDDVVRLVDGILGTTGPRALPAVDGRKRSGTNPGDYGTRCAVPTIAYVDGRLVFDCATEGVSYHYNIEAPPSGLGVENSVPYANTVTITVYATKTGYEDSDIVTQDIDLIGIPGDLNGDGAVTIADVTKLVETVIRKSQGQ